jgi:hypothetical protein
VRYRSRKQFSRLRPGEDYDDHLRQREALCAFADGNGIKVVDVPAARESSELERARLAAQPPYRLGLEIGGGSGTPGSIGHFVVWLKSKDNPPDEGGTL